MVQHTVSVIAGDGIGPEVISEGIKVLDEASEVMNFELNWVKYPFGADHYLKTGELLPENALKEMERHKAIYMGAVGDPRCREGILEKGILLALRFHFDEYINLRPVQLLEGVSTPLKDKTAKDIDFFVVRENTEDMYIGIGGRAKKGKSRQELELLRRLYKIKFGLDIDSDHEEIAYQLMVVSRQGAERAIRYAFQLARETERKKVTSVDKANVLTYTYGFWREIFNRVKEDFPDIETEFNYVDAVTMWFVKNPEWFKVVVTPNMFGDIITDLGAMIQGGLGVAAGANLNPEGTSMFEPIHGSAPKYKGLNKADPVATIMAGSLLLDTIGEKKAAKLVEKAVREVLRKRNVLTPDLGGTSTTSQMGEVISAKVRELGPSL
jgi:isocitrate/isopropylmalate dehydrogenase